MDENINVQETKSEKRKLKKSGIILLILLLLLLLMLICGGIFGGVKLLSAKGIIEEPEIFKTLLGMDEVPEEVYDGEISYDKSEPAYEGSLFDKFSKKDEKSEEPDDSQKDDVKAEGNKKVQKADKDEDSKTDTEDSKGTSCTNEKKTSGNVISKTVASIGEQVREIMPSANNIISTPTVVSNTPSSSNDTSSSDESDNNDSDDNSYVAPTGPKRKITPVPLPSGTPSGEPTPVPSGEPTPTVVPEPIVSPTPIVEPTPEPTPEPAPSINKKAEKVVADTGTLNRDYIKKIRKDGNLDEQTQYATVMVYMSGTDLEDNYGEATSDLIKMLGADYDLSKVNVVICAGGTNTWGSDYISSINNDCRVNMYYLNVDGTTSSADGIGKQTLTPIGTYGATDIGQSEILTGFIDTVTDNFPATNYGLIMWNHGGGVNVGVCSSDSNKDVTGTALETSEIESALMSTKLYESGNKLGFVGFDACLMGSTEIAYNLSPYCDFMIGSLEDSRGGWDYKGVLNTISKAADEDVTKKFDSSVAKSITDANSKAKASSNAELNSVACFDLSNIGDVTSSVNKISSEITKLWSDAEKAGNTDLATACFRALKQARIHSYDAGDGDTRSESSDNVDISDFLSNLSLYLGDINPELLSDENRTLIGTVKGDIETAIANVDKAVTAGVSFNGSSIYGSDGSTTEFWNDFDGSVISGASIYMPYMNAEDYMSLSYSEMSILDDYTEMVTKYAEESAIDAERIRRLADNIDYEDIFENADALSDKKIDIKNKGNIKSEYIEININDDYEDAEKSADSSGNPFEDFMDTVDSVKVVVAAKTQDEEGNDKYIRIGSSNLGLNVIKNTDESIKVLTKNVAQAVSDIREYYYISKKEDDSETVTGYATTVMDTEGKQASDDKISAIIEAMKSDTDEENPSEIEDNSGNYMIFSGKYYSDNSESTEGINVTHAFVYEYDYDSEGNQLETQSLVYKGSYQETDDGMELISGKYEAEQISFVESVIEDHGINMTDGLRMTVRTEFEKAYRICSQAIDLTLSDDENKNYYTLEIDTIAGDDGEKSEYVLSDDLGDLEVDLSIVPAGASPVRNVDEPRSSVNNESTKNSDENEPAIEQTESVESVAPDISTPKPQEDKETPTIRIIPAAEIVSEPAIADPEPSQPSAPADTNKDSDESNSEPVSSDTNDSSSKATNDTRIIESASDDGAAESN